MGVAGGTSCALANFREAIAKLVTDNEAIENSKNFGKLNFRFILSSSRCKGLGVLQVVGNELISQPITDHQLPNLLVQ
jgi:hypothetical protein